MAPAARFGNGDAGDDIPHGGDAAGPHRPGVSEGAEAEEREDIEGSAERGGAPQEGEDLREDTHPAAAGPGRDQDGHGVDARRGHQLCQVSQGAGAVARTGGGR